MKIYTFSIIPTTTHLVAINDGDLSEVSFVFDTSIVLGSDTNQFDKPLEQYADAGIPLKFVVSVDYGLYETKSVDLLDCIDAYWAAPEIKDWEQLDIVCSYKIPHTKKFLDMLMRRGLNDIVYSLDTTSLAEFCELVLRIGNCLGIPRAYIHDMTWLGHLIHVSSDLGGQVLDDDKLLTAIVKSYQIRNSDCCVPLESLC